MAQFEQGVELGRLLERQRRTEDAVVILTKDVKEVKAEVTDIRVTLQRWALVASLWGAGIMLVAGNDKLANLAVEFIRATTARGS